MNCGGKGRKSSFAAYHTSEVVSIFLFEIISDGRNKSLPKV